MDIRTYRAASVREALAMVRRDLGPGAALLHTRELKGGRLLSWIPGMRRIEVTASADVVVPSRVPAPELPAAEAALPGFRRVPAPARAASGERGNDVQEQLSELQAMVADLCRRSSPGTRGTWPEALFRLYTDLIEVEIGEDQARHLVERVRSESSTGEWIDPLLAKV